MDVTKSVKRSISFIRKYNKEIPESDLEQIAWVYILGHEKKIAELEEMEEVDLAQWRLHRELNRVMLTEVKRERAARGGYLTEDEVYYSPRQIADLLPFVLKGEQAQPVKDRPEISAGKDPAHGGDWLASWLDVQRAWQEAKLTDNERSILWCLYAEGTSQEVTGQFLELSQGAVSKAHNRALRKLSDALGGPKDRGCPYDCECHEEKLRRRPGRLWT